MEVTATKATFPKYPAYKDSGVDWLGEIPERWNTKKLKFLGKIYAGLNGKKGDDFSKEFEQGMKPFIPFTNIYNNFKIDDSKYQFVKIGDFENQNLVKKLDLLFLMSSETIEDIGKCSLFDGENSELYLNSFCKGFRIASSEVQPYFINYLLKGNTYRKYFSIVGRGFTRINIKQEYINDLIIPIPSPSEQTAIANFLDDKTTKIDRAIAKKEQLIALLKERKQIIIQNAVTKGLNYDSCDDFDSPDSQTKNQSPSANHKKSQCRRMKDSGVEWIGEIPEHWEVKKLKYEIKKAFSGGTPSTDKIDYWDGGVPWISSVDIKSDYLSNTNREISEKGLKHSSSSIAPGGSVVFVTRSGILQHTFALSILKKDMAINQDIKCLVLSDLLFEPFFLRLIQGNNTKILVETRQQAATVESINMDAFFNLFIPIPPRDEQTDIVAKIKDYSFKIDQAISLQQTQIEKLKEYKATLIDSAVTGKIKVSEL